MRYLTSARHNFRILSLILPFLFACSGASGQSYSISTFAGGGAPVNIPGTAAGLGGTPAVTVDGQGNLYFVDENDILRLDATTNILTLVAGDGTYGFSGDNGPATSAQLNFPFGVAVDSAGSVFIADSHNNRIRKVSNGIITTVAGNGLAGFSGDNGPATTAELNSPWGIAIDGAGNIYIADVLNQRVRQVTNGVITTVAGNGTVGSGGDNGPPTAAQLNGPIAVAVDASQNLYIAVAGNESIRKVSDGIITTVAGNGTQGFGGDNGPALAAQLNNPQGVAVDSAGNLYIADTQNSLIRRVSNGVITTFAGNRTQGFSGDGGPATSAEMNFPEGVAVGPGGVVYLADYHNSRIRAVSGGVITTVAGDGQPSGFSGDGGPAASAQVTAPAGLALDSGGNLFIADLGNQRIRKVSGGVITTFAGAGTAGFSGDNGPALSAQLSSPVAVALDASGNLFIADSGNNRIRIVSNGMINTIAGTGFAGIGSDTVDGDNGAATSAYLNEPSSVAVDSAGNLFIADTAHQRIREVSDGVITTVAGTGFAGFSGDNGPAGAAQLAGPTSIAIDASGNLYIADAGNNRIRVVSNGIIATVAGNGAQGFSGDGGPATGASLNSPRVIAVNSAGNLYIADTGNYRIREVTGGAITTIAGNGTPGYTGDNGPATSAELSVSGLVADAAGNVYFSDQTGERIRLLTPSSAPVQPKPVIQAVVSAVDYSTMMAPGSWVAIFGANLSPSVDVLTSLPLQNQLNGVSVAMSGTPLALRYVSPGQINALLPFGPPGYFQFAVSTPDGTSDPYQAALNTVAPSVYTLNETGTGAAFAFDSNFRTVSQIGTDPLILYASGLGPTNPPGNAAAGGATSEPFNRVANPVFAQIGGQPAQVLFAGLAPGLPGVYQLNVVPPAGPLADNSLIVSVEPGFPAVTSGTTTLPAPPAANTSNATGTVSLLYPVNGTQLGFSALLTAANLTATFDILAGAQPFRLNASCPGVTENIAFNPAAGVWEATLTVPTAPARNYDFSMFFNANGSALLITDFTTGRPFPDNIVPQSRVDPLARQALTNLPASDSAAGSPNASYLTQGTIPASGHVVIDSGHFSDLSVFGGFVIAPAPAGDELARRVGCALTLDNVVLSSTLSAFN